MVAYFGSKLKTMERAFELFLGGKGPVCTVPKSCSTRLELKSDLAVFPFIFMK